MPPSLGDQTRGRTNSTNKAAFEGWAVYALWPEIPPSIQNGGRIGYITHQGGIYLGGKTDSNRWFAEGTLKGYLIQKGSFLWRGSNYYALAEGGYHIDGRFSGGEEWKNLSLIRDQWNIHYGTLRRDDRAIGHERSAVGQKRHYVYDLSMDPIGFVESDAHLARAGGCALLVGFFHGDYRGLMEALKAAPDFETDIENNQVKTLGRDLLDLMKAAEQTQDMLRIGRKAGRAVRLPPIYNRQGSVFRGLDDIPYTIDVLRDIANKLSAAITKYTEDLRQANQQAVRLVEQDFKLWRELYTESGGFQGAWDPSRLLTSDSMFYGGPFSASGTKD
jgi:hypothetical protein